MNKITWMRTGLGLAIAVLLQACGGGAEDGPLATPAAAEKAGALTADASAGVSRPLFITESIVKPTVTADQVLAWAEGEYPTLFPRGAKTETLAYDFKQFSLRAYPGVKAGEVNYLGVTQGGTVFGLGEFTQGQLQRFGSVESYACRVSGACGGALKAIRRIYADAGSLQCRPGSGVSLIEMRKRLTDVGIRVGAANCSYAPVAVPAACGFPDARIYVFEIEASDLPLMPTASFGTVEKLNEGTGNSSEYPINIERACDY